MTKPELILCVRYAIKDGIDAVEEVNAEIAQRGHCWFAKFGQPVSLPLLQEMVSIGPGRAAVLLIAPKQAERPRVFRTFGLLAGGEKRPPNGEFPEYYQDHLKWASTWLKLTEAKTQIASLADLEVRSSSNPLPDALATSVKGHFFCVPRRG